jgi:SAUR family protein
MALNRSRHHFPSDRSLLGARQQLAQLNDKIRSRAGGLVLGSASASAIMAIKGYFWAPARLQGRKRKQQAAERGLPGGVGGGGDDSLGAALLDEAELPAVPRGYFAVYVGAEARRFVVPTAYLRQPAFRDLMERAAEEFGFAQAAGIRIPCREEDFEATVAALELASAAARRRPRPGRATAAAEPKLPEARSL